MSGSFASGGELVQAAIRVKGLESAVVQAEVIAAVQKQPGVRTVTVVEDMLHVVYDPLQMSEHQLEGVLRASGHQPECGDAERDSPFA